MDKKKFSGYQVAAACFIVLFMHTGSLNTASVFFSPIAEANGFSVGNISLMVTFSTVTSSVLGLSLAKRIIEKFSPKRVLLFGSFLCAGHYLLYSMGTKLWEYYLGAVLGGIVASIASTSVISAVISEWFIDRRVTVLGFVMGGSSLGGAVWQLVSGFLIEAYDYRIAYRVLAVALVVVPPAVNLLFIRTPSDLGEKALGADQVIITHTGKQERVANAGLTAKEIFCTASFYILFAGVLCGSFALGSYKSYLGSCLISCGIKPGAASTYVAMVSFLGALAIMLLGTVAQNVGIRIYLIIMFSGGIIGSLMIAVAGETSSISILFISMFWGALLTSCGTTLVPTVCTSAFGTKDYASIVVYLQSATFIGLALYPIVYKRLLNMWTISDCYYVTAAFAGVALILCLIGITISPFQKCKRV